jgi:hypothetical protein
MRLLGYAFLFTLLVLPLAVGGAVYLALADRPTVDRPVAFTPADIERARRIVDQHDSRTMRAGTLRTISLTQEDADLALNYLASRYANGKTRVVLTQGAAAISASIELPANPLGRYLNVSTALRETSALPVVDALRIGRLPVPAWLANFLLERAVLLLGTREDYRIASDIVRQVSISGDRLSVTYVWQANLPDRIKAVMLPREDQERLKSYQSRLADLAARFPRGASAALADLLPPLFELAVERSASGDPVAENRAAILIAALFVNGRGLGAILPAARDWPQPTPRRVLLAGREDFPQHFMVSAAIAANAGGPLADAIGLYKEIDDSRGGSGFSFNDIAADRAGTRFGELAAGSRESALKLQRLVAAGVREAELVPPVSDLPEFMQEAEFKRRYGGVGAPAYRRTMDDIERRIAALPLYR